jgi:hypothetical protein
MPVTGVAGPHAKPQLRRLTRLAQRVKQHETAFEAVAVPASARRTTHQPGQIDQPCRRQARRAGGLRREMLDERRQRLARLEAPRPPRAKQHPRRRARLIGGLDRRADPTRPRAGA